MADSIFELLAPHFQHGKIADARDAQPSLQDGISRPYIARLTTLSLDSLTSTESNAIRQSSQSTVRSIQGLSKRSYRSIIAANNSLSGLSAHLPVLDTCSSSLRSAIPDVEAATARFAAKYERSQDSAARRKRQQLLHLSNNVDRLGNILELPVLLSSIVSSSTASSSTASGGASVSGYASALDIHAQVKRLVALYPSSELVKEISGQSADAILNLVTILITSLDSPGLKLAAAMRAIGWLRRINPDLVKSEQGASGTEGFGTRSPHDADDALGAIFLTCRLGTMRRTLTALDPLKELANSETHRRRTQGSSSATWSDGTQTERYLKRYIEVFREHSFAIISTYKSIFQDSLSLPNGHTTEIQDEEHSTQIRRLGTYNCRPSVLATFVPHVAEMLFSTLRAYMPNMTDSTARESLLTQVLYCAASLGRLGADFSTTLALMEEELRPGPASASPSTYARPDHEREWVRVQRKHRAQASRLELLASGVIGARKPSIASQDIQAGA